MPVDWVCVERWITPVLQRERFTEQLLLALYSRLPPGAQRDALSPALHTHEEQKRALAKCAEVPGGAQTSTDPAPPHCLRCLAEQLLDLQRRQEQTLLRLVQDIVAPDQPLRPVLHEMRRRAGLQSDRLERLLDFLPPHEPH